MHNVPANQQEVSAERLIILAVQSGRIVLLFDTRSIGMAIKKTLMHQVRIDAKEQETFILAAEMAGVTLAAWSRSRLRDAAIRELRALHIEPPILRQTSEPAEEGE